MERNTFSDEMRRLREDKGLTIEQMSDAMNGHLTITMIKGMEQGAFVVGGDEFILRLADFFGVSRWDLCVLANKARAHYLRTKGARYLFEEEVEVFADGSRRRRRAEYSSEEDWIRKHFSREIFDNLCEGYDRRQRVNPRRRPQAKVNW